LRSGQRPLIALPGHRRRKKWSSSMARMAESPPARIIAKTTHGSSRETASPGRFHDFCFGFSIHLASVRNHAAKNVLGNGWHNTDLNRWPE
jgi:hypothetical protein